jgi:hypothetical protein
MSKPHYSWIAALGLFSLLLAGVALLRSGGAQAQGQYPIMNDIANKVIQKYQNSSCEQLWVQKSAHAPPSMEEQRVIGVLRDDPQMRAAFIAMIAPPIANKMFDCGMIP